MANVIPLNEYLVVEVLKNEKEGGGIILPDAHHKEEFGVGKVLATDETIEIIVVGDKVVFDKYLLINVKIEEEELKFIKFSDVLGIIKKEENVER